MLLNGLSHEEKIAFWNIANVLAAVDGNISEEESVLKQYSEEMGVDFKFVDDPAAIDIKSELDVLRTDNLKNRKIVYFELYSVAYADTELHEKEQSILNEVCSVLEISDDVRTTLETSVKTIFDTYRKLGEVLEG